MPQLVPPPSSPDGVASLATPPDADHDVQQELASLRSEVVGLRAALTSRATIDQARGILIGRYRISADQAFRVLVRWSQHRNVKLRTIAETLVGMHQVAPDAPAAPDPALQQWLEEQLAGPSGEDGPPPAQSTGATAQ